MVTRRVAGSKPSARASSDLDAFRRHRGEAPPASSSALGRALDAIPASDDPAITFAGLARACVPAFADGCCIELSDQGTQGREVEPLFRAVFPPDPPHAEKPWPEGGQGSGPRHFLHTPIHGPSRAGYLSYAGVLTHWWASRKPAESDTLTADLMTRHAVAVVDRQRLMASAARADDRASDVALAAISGRTINIAVGIVVRQCGLSAEDAERTLRQASRSTGSSLYEVAAKVVHAAGFAGPVEAEMVPHAGTGRGRLRPVRSPRR